jgi:hypothetical protein
VSVDHARINADFGVDNFGDTHLPVRVSDHDPVRVAITVPEFRSADLSATASTDASSAHVGDTVRFDVGVANAGPGAADFASVALVFDALLSPAVTAPAGWACNAPVQEAGTTTVTCTTASLAPGAGAQFAVEVIAPDARGGDVLDLAVATASHITDPANGNNDAHAQVAVAASADLAMSLSGPAKKLHYARTEAFPVTLHNAGPDAAWQPVVVLHGDAPAGNVAITAPAGWQCATEGADAGTFESRCTYAGALAAGASQRFDFAITIPARPNATQSLHLQATASATTPEADPGDNTAAYSNRIVGVP